MRLTPFAIGNTLASVKCKFSTLCTWAFASIMHLCSTTFISQQNRDQSWQGMLNAVVTIDNEGPPRHTYGIVGFHQNSDHRPVWALHCCNGCSGAANAAKTCSSDHHVVATSFANEAADTPDTSLSVSSDIGQAGRMKVVSYHRRPICRV